MITRHLGSQIDALVDEQLAEPARRRALNHLHDCQDCADLVAQHRRQRRLTHALQPLPVPGSLQERLLALGAEGARPEAVQAAPWQGMPRRRRPGSLLALAVASAAGVGLAGAGVCYLLGGPADLTAAAVTAQQSTTAPATMQAGGGWPAGLVAPQQLPAGTGITSAAALPSGLVQVELAVGGETVLVREGLGALRLDDTEVSDTTSLGGVEAHLVHDWWVAQIGDHVVAVHGPRAQAHQVLRSFEPAQASVPARVLAGWSVMHGG